MKRNASRLLSILLALCLALALLPGTALAAGSGVRGDVTWTLDDNGHLTLSGTGVINQPDHLDEEWIDQVKTIDIGEGITEIGPVAFELGGCITKVTLPESLTKIGGAAFYFESNLKEINIPAGVTEIGDYAFFGCDSLADIYYGGSESQWNQLKIGEGNDPLDTAAIHYNGAAPAPSASAGVSVTVNGSAVVWTDAEPFIDENNRTMVPLRAVADAMGLDVNWDAAAKTVIITG